MKRKSILAGLLALTGSASVGLADHYFCGAVSNSWNQGANWKSVGDCTGLNAGVPTAADKVIIPSGKTCDVDISNAEADHIVVESGAVLNILAGSSGSGNERRLTLDSGNSTTSAIDGTLNLEGQYSKLVFIIISPTLTTTGSGKIVGKDDDATIDFSGLDLTSEITIEGNMRIFASGSNDVFTNLNTVNANRAGLLLFDANLRIEDDSSAFWKVTEPTGAGIAALQLDHLTQHGTSFAVLDGEFSVTAGHLIFGSGVITTGKLKHYSGVIFTGVDAFARFSDDGDASGPCD